VLFAICSDVSENRFDLVSTIGQTFGHGLVNINKSNTVCDFIFITI